MRGRKQSSHCRTRKTHHWAIVSIVSVNASKRAEYILHEDAYEIGFKLSGHQDDMNEDIWDFQFQTLREYYEKYGHCEWFWAVTRFTFILNTRTEPPPVSHPAMQEKCQLDTIVTHNWVNGSTVSVKYLPLKKLLLQNETRVNAFSNSTFFSRPIKDFVVAEV
jgi:hypothetical protein